MTWLAVGIGGAVGSVLRYGVSVTTNRLVGETVPYATAAVNVVGCLIAGLLLGAVDSSRVELSPANRAFLFAGVLGGFTTFSSFAVDTLLLARAGATTAAVLNLSAQVVMGMTAVFAGYWLLK